MYWCQTKYIIYDNYGTPGGGIPAGRPDRSTGQRGSRPGRLQPAVGVRAVTAVPGGRSVWPGAGTFRTAPREGTKTGHPPVACEGRSRLVSGSTARRRRGGTGSRPPRRRSVLRTTAPRWTVRLAHDRRQPCRHPPGSGGRDLAPALHRHDTLSTSDTLNIEYLLVFERNINKLSVLIYIKYLLFVRTRRPARRRLRAGVR